jgi:predicted transcriptional regulator
MQDSQQGGTDVAETPDTELLNLTTVIVAAHASNNAISVDEIPSLIREVHKALSWLGSEPKPVQSPAVPIKRSIQKDAITCLECGWSAKFLGRHLSTAHSLSAKAYQEKWKLPSDYPLVAPSYAARRSALAKEIGLGTMPRRAAP